MKNSSHASSIEGAFASAEIPLSLRKVSEKLSLTFELIIIVISFKTSENAPRRMFMKRSLLLLTLCFNLLLVQQCQAASSSPTPQQQFTLDHPSASDQSSHDPLTTSEPLLRYPTQTPTMTTVQPQPQPQPQPTPKAVPSIQQAPEVITENYNTPGYNYSGSGLTPSDPCCHSPPPEDGPCGDNYRLYCHYRPCYFYSTHCEYVPEYEYQPCCRYIEEKYNETRTRMVKQYYTEEECRLVLDYYTEPCWQYVQCYNEETCCYEEVPQYYEEECCRYIPEYYEQTYCQEVPEYYEEECIRYVPQYYYICHCRYRPQYTYQKQCEYVPQYYYKKEGTCDTKEMFIAPCR